MSASQTGNGADRSSLKVGELARRTGLTVRTLHHYDEIGLLVPSRRTPSGHRLYGSHEVRRLQQIASLRRVGLSLDEIARCLDDEGWSLERTLDLHIDRIRRDIAEQERLCGLLESLRRRAAADESPSLDELAEAIELTIRLEEYYTPEQRETLARRAEDVGADRMREVQEEWNRLFERFGAAMDRDLPPEHPDVAALARNARDLVGEFTGGDPGIASSLDRLYRVEGPDRILGDHGPALREGLWDYMGAARRALETSG